MLNTDCKTIQIPFKNPQFHLMLLSMDSHTVDVFGAKSSTTITTLNASDEKRFSEQLQHCNLSTVEKAFCQRAQSVMMISAVRTNSSFFAPFWECHTVARKLSTVMDSIGVDLYQGNAFNPSMDLSQQNAYGVPLSETFLTVKAYQKESSNKFFLVTEGMSRFGLPELTLQEVPGNLGADGAYLLRTIAQYLWSKLDHIHPEQPYLSVEETTELPAVFCEWGNPAFHEADELNIPFALEVFESRVETLLVVRQPRGYDDYYDWFLSVTESIREHRLSIQRKSELAQQDLQVASLAA